MTNIDKILQDIDDLMFEKVESHLTPVQEAILTGVWQGQKYWQIAQSFNGCSESHIKKEAANLWKKLGKVLDEDVNKDNLRSKLERKYRVSQTSNFGHCLQVNQGNIHICDQSLQTINNGKKTTNFLRNDDQSPIIDLTKAPELRYNYGRNLEISTLKEWLDHKTRLITIYGLSGIGKTALTLKLVSEIAPQFDYIIYRSLENIPQLIALKDDLKQFFSQSLSTPLPDIIDYLISYRCLIILDDVQNIFKQGELAGKYLTDCQDYHKFFQQIATTSHQSCLILISWEQPREFITLKSDNLRSLYLQGLDSQAEEIFQEYSLKNQEKWSELITLYQGHPSWLNIITSTIVELFNGDVSLFLEQMQDEIYLGDIETLIESHLQRLSATEKKVMHWLANQTEAVEKFPKTANLDLSQSEFWAAIQSLMRRCLLDKLPSETSSYFPINPVFKSYLKRNPND
ncbi:MAG: ATPase [Microcystis aeruginosa Ma_QC_Ch_20071001_S25]|uniref:ATPase n=1 Tax=Microcystis aeruginosa Ma_QC_Ch_20071001_S25D TaxID=2486250 RepID=A0A552FN02_MICAE|nr:MAG: ATPase [Microcystis aeruginosa Ma_QC_Ch_20071001_S25D]TRU49346.1 MAG: ATPase [Microcystis aeruginosa Ma_QC_Ch_20071001_S25]TRU60650.1 MAG: ATPase [Microcystis aeruginosa Ma_QC_Ch_20071001_M135]